jgi:uncharacterized protein YhaN
LELRIRRGEVLPFIVDDVLVHLDDRRSQHALRALADFSALTQVLVFTHHAHVLELANESIPGRFHATEFRVVATAT